MHFFAELFFNIGLNNLLRRGSGGPILSPTCSNTIYRASFLGTVSNIEWRGNAILPQCHAFKIQDQISSQWQAFKSQSGQ